jgi:pyruvate,water dikinase
MRQIFLEIGTRLVKRGTINQAEDVVYLEPHQMREYLANGGSHVEAVTREKAEMARWAKVTPPPFIGTDYGGPPESSMGRAISMFWGMPPVRFTTATEVTGIPVSAGSARGIARLIMNIREADRLQKGDILVAPPPHPRGPRSSASPPPPSLTSAAHSATAASWPGNTASPASAVPATAQPQ